MINRRTFVGAVAGALAVGAHCSIAQSTPRTYRIGIMRPTARPKNEDLYSSEALLPAALARMGYIEGRNLVIESRYAGGDAQQLDAFAREFVQMGVDVIVAVASAAILAAKRATATIPIVMWGNFDPVASGFVTSLAHPGGNITGVLIAPEGTLGAKKLELLKETVPRAKRVAVLAPEEPSSLRVQGPELEAAAAALGLDLTVVVVRKDDYGEAFSRLTATRPDALFVIATTFFVRDRKPIIALAIRNRLPSVWEWREQVADGGFMAYGASLSARLERVAEYIDRILKGASPGNLPVDQPTNFRFVINARTAKAIGLTVPRALLLRADEVIE